MERGSNSRMLKQSSQPHSTSTLHTALLHISVVKLHIFISVTTHYNRKCRLAKLLHPKGPTLMTPPAGLASFSQLAENKRLLHPGKNSFCLQKILFVT